MFELSFEIDQTDHIFINLKITTASLTKTLLFQIGLIY